IDSASALSYESPALPTEGSMRRLAAALTARTWGVDAGGGAHGEGARVEGVDVAYAQTLAIQTEGPQRLLCLGPPLGISVGRRGVTSTENEWTIGLDAPMAASAGTVSTSRL